MSRTPLPDLLTWAYQELARIEATIDARAASTPDGLIRWGMPLAEAVEARAALSQAPCLQTTTRTAKADTSATPQSLLAAAIQVHHALVTASGQTTGADQFACLHAAAFLNRLRDLLE